MENCNTRLEIVRFVRPMRGHSHAHLVQAEDQKLYVCKSPTSPEGKRSLINEWLASSVFKWVGIAAPEIQLLTCSSDVAFTKLYDSTTARKPSLGATQLGSRLPVDPEVSAIYDFLPRKLYSRVLNREDFIKVYTLDWITGQADRRQAVFVHDKNSPRSGLRALFIDHGRCFGGQDWQPGQSGYPPIDILQPGIGCLVTRMRLISETFERLAELRESDLEAWSQHLPDEWFTLDDRRQLRSLHQAILHRIKSQNKTLVHELGERFGIAFNG